MSLSPLAFRSVIAALLRCGRTWPVILLTAIPSAAAQAAPARHTSSGDSSTARPRVVAGGVLAGGAPRSRALVVVLHGGSWKGDPPEQLATSALAEFSAPATRAGLRVLVPPAPILSPGGEYRVPWLAPEGEALVLALLDAEVAAGRADRDRLYLAGHGAGATGALTLAARHADRIAAVAAWSGTPEPLWDEQRRVVGLAENVVSGLSRMPVYLWTGTDDRSLDAQALQLFVSGLRAARAGPSANSFLWEQSAGGHGYGPAGIEGGLRFLANQRLVREAPRQGTRPG